MRTNVLLLILSACCCLTASAQLQDHNKVVKLMGSRFEITAVHSDPQVAWDAINAGIAEITRIEKLISSWDPNSQTSEVVRNAGIKPVRVDKELYDLIERSIRVSKLTDGAFDISYASMDRIWKFDGSMTEMPSPQAAAAAASKINYQNIVLDKEAQTVFLKKEGMKIGFGAIGKGYAAFKAKGIMIDLGVENGLVNASGDLIAWGRQADGGDWKIGIGDPQNPDKVMSWLNIRDGAVVTSGDYERFVMFDGKRYAHIIDPRTGYPTTGIKSVTIICPNPELADALATSVFVLGEKKGMDLINQLKGIECLVITDENRISTSDNMELEPTEISKEK